MGFTDDDLSFDQAQVESVPVLPGPPAAVVLAAPVLAVEVANATKPPPKQPNTKRAGRPQAVSSVSSDEDDTDLDNVDIDDVLDTRPLSTKQGVARAAKVLEKKIKNEVVQTTGRRVKERELTPKALANREASEAIPGVRKAERLETDLEMWAKSLKEHEDAIKSYAASVAAMELLVAVDPSVSSQLATAKRKLGKKQASLHKIEQQIDVLKTRQIRSDLQTLAHAAPVDTAARLALEAHPEYQRLHELIPKNAPNLGSSKSAAMRKLATRVVDKTMIPGITFANASREIEGLAKTASRAAAVQHQAFLRTTRKAYDAACLLDVAAGGHENAKQVALRTAAYVDKHRPRERVSMNDLVMEDDQPDQDWEPVVLRKTNVAVEEVGVRMRNRHARRRAARAAEAYFRDGNTGVLRPVSTYALTQIVENAGSLEAPRADNAKDEEGTHNPYGNGQPWRDILNAWNGHPDFIAAIDFLLSVGKDLWREHSLLEIELLQVAYSLGLFNHLRQQALRTGFRQANVDLVRIDHPVVTALRAGGDMAAAFAGWKAEVSAKLLHGEPGEPDPGLWRSNFGRQRAAALNLSAEELAKRRAHEARIAAETAEAAEAARVERERSEFTERTARQQRVQRYGLVQAPRAMVLSLAVASLLPMLPSMDATCVNLTRAHQYSNVLVDEVFDHESFIRTTQYMCEDTPRIDCGFVAGCYLLRGGRPNLFDVDFVSAADQVAAVPTTRVYNANLGYIVALLLGLVLPMRAQFGMWLLAVVSTATFFNLYGFVDLALPFTRQLHKHALTHAIPCEDMEFAVPTFPSRAQYIADVDAVQCVEFDAGVCGQFRSVYSHAPKVVVHEYNPQSIVPRLRIRMRDQARYEHNVRHAEQWLGEWFDEGVARVRASMAGLADAANLVALDAFNSAKRDVRQFADRATVAAEETLSWANAAHERAAERASDVTETWSRWLMRWFGFADDREALVLWVEGQNILSGGNSKGDGPTAIEFALYRRDGEALVQAIRNAGTTYEDWEAANPMHPLRLLRNAGTFTFWVGVPNIVGAAFHVGALQFDVPPGVDVLVYCSGDTDDTVGVTPSNISTSLLRAAYIAKIDVNVLPAACGVLLAGRTKVGVGAPYSDAWGLPYDTMDQAGQPWLVFYPRLPHTEWLWIAADNHHPVRVMHLPSGRVVNGGFWSTNGAMGTFVHIEGRNAAVYYPGLENALTEGYRDETGKRTYGFRLAPMPGRRWYWGHFWGSLNNPNYQIYLSAALDKPTVVDLTVEAVGLVVLAAWYHWIMFYDCLGSWWIPTLFCPSWQTVVLSFVLHLVASMLCAAVARGTMGLRHLSNPVAAMWLVLAVITGPASSPEILVPEEFHQARLMLQFQDQEDSRHLASLARVHHVPAERIMYDTRMVLPAPPPNVRRPLLTPWNHIFDLRPGLNPQWRYARYCCADLITYPLERRIRAPKGVVCQPEEMGAVHKGGFVADGYRKPMEPKRCVHNSIFVVQNRLGAALPPYNQRIFEDFCDFVANGWPFNGAPLLRADSIRYVPMDHIDYAEHFPSAKRALYRLAEVGYHFSRAFSEPANNLALMRLPLGSQQTERWANDTCAMMLKIGEKSMAIANGTLKRRPRMVANPYIPLPGINMRYVQDIATCAYHLNYGSHVYPFKKEFFEELNRLVVNNPVIGRELHVRVAVAYDNPELVYRVYEALNTPARITAFVVGDDLLIIDHQGLQIRVYASDVKRFDASQRPRLHHARAKLFWHVGAAQEMIQQMSTGWSGAFSNKVSFGPSHAQLSGKDDTTLNNTTAVVAAVVYTYVGANQNVPLDFDATFDSIGFEVEQKNIYIAADQYHLLEQITFLSLALIPGHYEFVRDTTTEQEFRISPFAMAPLPFRLISRIFCDTAPVVWSVRLRDDTSSWLKQFQFMRALPVARHIWNAIATQTPCGGSFEQGIKNVGGTFRCTDQTLQWFSRRYGLTLDAIDVLDDYVAHAVRVWHCVPGQPVPILFIDHPDYAKCVRVDMD